MSGPTPYPEVNALLAELLDGARAILGPQFVGMMLYGSLAAGDFDAASDVDALVVTSEEISDASFAALAAMHLRINAGESRWAIQLEVSYIPLFALRRYDPERAVHPHLERGKGAPLHRMRHDASWVVQRQVLRERGMVLAGPAPASLIDPVAPDDLRAAMRQALRSWAAPMLEQDRPFDWHGYQTYTVLTLCRILYTLENGSVVSKITAARWALTALDARWTGLIERAAEGRLAPQREIPEGDVDGTLAFVRYALEQ